MISSTLILALITALIPFLAALATFLYKTLAARLPHNKQALLLSAAHTAVSGAEQLGMDNPAKKAFAEAAIGAALKNFGVGINPIYINAAIEASVLALHRPVTPIEVVAPGVRPPAQAIMPVVGVSTPASVPAVGPIVPGK